MKRKSTICLAVICAMAVSCSGSPESPVSPTGVDQTVTFLNPDGSSLKVRAPGGLSPNGGVLNTRRPTLSFTNPAGLYASVGLAYELEIQDAGGGVVYSRIIGESAGSSSHTVDTDLAYATTLWWRVRGRLGDQTGPWADFAQIRTPDPPAPPPPPTPTPGGGPGTLPFPVPAACGPGDPSNRFACVAAVAALSVEWQGCAAGSGTRCHRFSRQVVFALSQSDPNWKMIQAAPGGQSCNCNFCGPSDGTMFREDTTVYGGNRVFDMVVGAGGPTPGLNWSAVVGPRPGDIPADAPLCVP
jgi:hypothetical protein